MSLSVHSIFILYLNSKKLLVKQIQLFGELLFLIRLKFSGKFFQFTQKLSNRKRQREDQIFENILLI